MARHLSQLDIDVYIYIAEGDAEYQYDPLADMKANERSWQKFSELAQSIDRLQQEVGLSLKEAKKIEQKRLTTDFKSQADIESIEKIAQISIKKIKNFVQKYKMVEFPGMPEKTHTKSTATKSPPRRPRSPGKIPESHSNVITSALF